jgi:hypothetical protein
MSRQFTSPAVNYRTLQRAGVVAFLDQAQGLVVAVLDLQARRFGDGGDGVVGVVGLAGGEA